MNVDAELINAIVNLINAVDDKLILILAIILSVFLIIRKLIDDKNKRYYYDSMLKEKNKQIENLADECRRYRDIYLPKMGLAVEEMKKISASDVVK